MKKTIRIDASALKHSLCMLDFYRTVIEGIRSPVNNNDVEFGSAVHLFIKLMYENKGDFSIAIHRAMQYYRSTPMNIKPEKRYLDEKHLMGVCLRYWQEYLEKDDFEILHYDDGKPAVEVKFSNKYYEDENFIILLEGTIDKIGKFRNGAYGIGDYKTTSSWKHDDYLKEYELSTQLRFYVLNIFLDAENNPDGICAQMTKLPFVSYIDGIFLNGANKVEFKRSRAFHFKAPDIARYRSMLDGLIAKLVYILKNNLIPPPEGILNGACNANFGCPTKVLCTSEDKIAYDLNFKNHFVIREYKPLEFGKEPDKKESAT